MKSLEIFLLGNFVILLDGVDITEVLRTRKERAILAYLAEESTRIHSRETIAEFFWPDRPENYARMSLRQAFLGIRKALGGADSATPIIRIADETVQFNAQNAWLDTAAFTNHLTTVRNHHHPHLHTCQSCIHHLEQAIEMYRGDFLQDLLIGELASFQEWAIFQRERHFRRMLEALQAIAEVYSKQGNYDLAYQFAWRYVNMAPLEESAHRLLMRLLNVTGRRAAALQQYQLCKAFLARELAIEPSPETNKLYEQIKLGLPVERPDTGSLNPAPPPPATGTLPTRPRARPTGPLYDPFTQIPLSTLFMDRLTHALVRMEREHFYVVVVCLAVTIPPNMDMTPEFKNLVLQNLARRLVGSLRKGDTVGRLRDDAATAKVERHVADAVSKGAKVVVNDLNTAKMSIPDMVVDDQKLLTGLLKPIAQHR